MKLEQILFYLSVVGDLVLFFYAIRGAIRAVKLFREKNLESALWSASAACALGGLALMLPVSLFSNEQGISKTALLIGWGAAFFFLATAMKHALRRIPTLAADVAIVGMFVAFAVSGSWAWFWAAGIAMAVVWIAARKLVPRKRQTVASHGAQLGPKNDPFEEFYGPEPDLDNPYRIGHH